MEKSPACVAMSAIADEITDPRGKTFADKYPYPKEQSTTVDIQPNDNRREAGTWNYADVDNLNTDQITSGDFYPSLNTPL